MTANATMEMILFRSILSDELFLLVRPFRRRDYFNCRIVLALSCSCGRRAFDNAELLKLLRVARQAKPAARGSLFGECGSGFRERRFIWPNRFNSMRSCLSIHPGYRRRHNFPRPAAPEEMG